MKFAQQKNPDFIFLPLFLLGFYLIHLRSYIFFHSLAELSVVLVSFLIFIISFQTIQFTHNRSISFIGAAYLAVGLLDLFHTLVFPEVNLWPEKSTTNRAIFFWINARLIESISLAIFFAAPPKKITLGQNFILFSTLAGVVIFVGLTEDFKGVFFENGLGLTALKKSLEYMIIAILVIGLISLFRNKNQYTKTQQRLYFLAISTTILSEFSFTLYADPSGFYNAAGHYLKLVSFYFIYRVIISEGLRNPFSLLDRELNQYQNRLECQVKIRTNELQRAYEMIESQKVKLQQYLDIAEVLLIALDGEGNVTLINPKGCQVLEAKEELILGKNWFDHFLLEENRTQVKELHIKSMLGEKSLVQHYENFIVTGKGTKKLIQWHNSYIKNDKGQVTGIFSSGLDVTEERLLKDELAFSEEQLRTLLAVSQDAIVTINQNNNLIFWNQGATNIFGFTSEEMLGHSVNKIIPIASQKAHAKAVERVANTGKSKLTGKILEMKGKKKDGTEVPVELSLSQWNLRGHTYFSGIMRDITARKAFEAQNIELINALDHVKEIIFSTDNKGKIIYSNLSFREQVSTFPKSVLNEGTRFNPTGFVDGESMWLILKSLKETHGWKGERYFECEDGSFRYFDCSISSLSSLSGESAKFLFIIIETTSKRLENAKLIQSQKMESLGTLAGGVAHEINNPLSYVDSNLNSLISYLEQLNQVDELSLQLEDSIKNKNIDSEIALSKVKKIKDEVQYSSIKNDMPPLVADMVDGLERMKDIVSSLKNFSYADKHLLVDTDINESLRQTVKIAWNSLKYHCTVKEEFGEIPLVKCYPQELNQVFLNLVINASQAIEKKGEITLRTQLLADKVQIQVIDDGIGIKKKHLTRVFEPFFTTKEVGTGTGLGLSVSYKIIKDHQGALTVESTFGKGSCFTVLIPIDSNP